jgi:hypothetical protein
MLAYVVIYRQCVMLYYSVVNSNSIACDGKSSVAFNLFSGRKLTPAFCSFKYGLQSELYFVYYALCSLITVVFKGYT